MKINITPMGARHVPPVFDVEIRSQEFPIDYPDLKGIPDDPKRFGYVVVAGAKVVGNAVLHYSETNTEDLILERIAILPSYRRMGLSQRLLTRIAQDDPSKKLVLYIPEYKAPTGDPDSIAEWLWQVGFRAKTTKPGYFKRYNREYDAYVFKTKARREKSDG